MVPAGCGSDPMECHRHVAALVDRRTPWTRVAPRSSERRAVSRHQVSIADRLRQASRLLRSEGVQGVSGRARRRAAGALWPSGAESLPVSGHDLRRAAALMANGNAFPPPLPWREDEPLTVAWVDLPPSQGSGGQTTIYRMVEALESMGHRNVLYVLDNHGWSLAQHRATVHRCWPGVRAEIRDVRDGIEDAHAVMATCWESVYPVIASPAAGARMYFVQDYEPMFHPAGSKYLLAEATYQFGLQGVTAGRWLAQKLTKEHGMAADFFEFGCDVDTYHLDASPDSARRRQGICYYCRPATPRRAHELAMAALELFAEEHPDVEIHFYGERLANLPFRATQHGLLTPAELNQLYNRCVAGLTLSATNVSLVPHEMLASGCIPVVNDAEHNRLVLANDHVSYARATPFDLAAALADLLARPPEQREVLAAQGSVSVAGASWATAAQQVEGAIVRAVAARQDLVRS